MNADDRLSAWLAHRRGPSPPDDLTDRIMTALPAVSIRASTPPRRGRRWLPSVLWTAAAVVCAARIYSVVSVVAPVAMEVDEPEHRKVADDDSAVS